jgi:hypothetical protein
MEYVSEFYFYSRLRPLPVENFVTVQLPPLKKGAVSGYKILSLSLTDQDVLKNYKVQNYKMHCQPPFFSFIISQLVLLKRGFS